LKTLLPLFISFLLSIAVLSIRSQDIENIILPDDNFGYIPQDILITENCFSQNTSGLIFVYSFRKITVINKTSNAILHHFEISDYGRNSEKYSELDRIPSISFMAFNEIDKELYYVDPTPGYYLNIRYIKFNDDKSINGQGIAVGVRPDISSNEEFLLSGYTILKYNDNSGRLYLVANGTGISSLNSFLSVYKKDQSLPFTLQYESIFEDDIDYYDIAFNRNNDGSGIDHFFTSRDNFWEIYEINATGTITTMISNINLGSSGVYKNGWFLPIYDNSANKILCLPHNDRYDGNGTYNVCEIDCSQTTPVFTVLNNFPVPDSKVFNAGVYNPNTGITLLSIKPGSESEEFLYYYDHVTGLSDEVTNFSAGDDIQNLGSYMTYDAFGNYILTRKNEIAKLSLDTLDYTVTESIICEGYNNYFSKVILNGTSTTVKLNAINILSGSIDRFRYDAGQYLPSFTGPLETGETLYESVFNPIYGKAYFYSRTDHGNSKIIAVNSEDNSSYTFKNIPHSIGGCVYNPYTNELLVSQYHEGVSEILVFDACSGTQESTIEISEKDYIESLYISNLGYLYVSTGMRYDDTNPAIYIFDARSTNYSSVGNIEILNLTSSNLPHSRLKSGYFVEAGTGVFAFFSEVEETATDLTEGSSNGNLYWIGYDEQQGNYTATSLLAGKNFRDIIFDKESNRIFMLTNDEILYADWNEQTHSFIGLPLSVTLPANYTLLHSIDMSFDKQFGNVYFSAKLTDGKQYIWLLPCDFDGTYTPATIEEFTSEENEIISIYFNPVNRKLYAYLLPGSENITDRDTYLYWYDPEQLTDGMIALNDESRNNKSLPDSKPDGYMYYNRNRFLCDNYNLKIYIPNGMQSNISCLTLQHEYLPLDGITWISYPRVESQAQPQQINAPDAMNNMIIGSDITSGELKNLNINDGSNDYLGWNDNLEAWETDPSDPLDWIFSIYGYVLDFTDTEKRCLKLTGNVEDPATEIQLSSSWENWVGYYLPYPQHPIHAIPDEFLEDLYLVRGQYWTCYKDYFDGQPTPCWVCAVNRGHYNYVNYGDMVILNANQNISDFHWQSAGTKAIDKEERAESSYYIYEEQANYTPVFIELDTTDNPLEIGAFVEDSCVGATTVYADDSLVLINAYTGSLSGDIEFREHYGGMKSESLPIKRYSVKNPQSLTYENRTISTRENKPYYLVSFKKNGSMTYADVGKSTLAISCFPNPAGSNCEINYTLALKGYIRIALYDQFGREVNIIHDGHNDAGTYSLSFNCSDQQGKALSNGLYIVRIQNNKEQNQCKLIILN